MKPGNIHPIAVILYFISLMLPSVMLSSPIIILMLFLVGISIVIYFGEYNRLRFLKYVFFLYFLISLIVNFIFTNSGSTIIFQLNNLPVIKYKRLSLELVIFTLTGTIRLLYIMVIFSIVSIISSEDRMMSFLSSFFKRFPLLLSFTIRLIPKLTSDYKRLEHLFKLRGIASLSNNNKLLKSINPKRKKSLIRRIKEIMNPVIMTALIRTLLMNSLEDSLQFAESMQSRGFGDFNRRSSFSKSTFTISDFLIMILSTGYIVYSIFLLVYSIGTKSIYPKFKFTYYLNLNELLSIIIIITFNLVLFLLYFKREQLSGKYNH